jgi:hypothetical protein
MVDMKNEDQGCLILAMGLLGFAALGLEYDYVRASYVRIVMVFLLHDCLGPHFQFVIIETLKKGSIRNRLVRGNLSEK